MYQIERRAEARARRIWREQRGEFSHLVDVFGTSPVLPASLVGEVHGATSRLEASDIGRDIQFAAAGLVARQTGSAPEVGSPELSYAAWRAGATGIFLAEASRLQMAGADERATRDRLLTGKDGRASAWQLALNSLVLATALLVWGHGNGLVVRMGRAASERDGIEYQKQAIAHLDARTTPICKAVNRQIRPLDKPFDTKAGRIMNPPFHHRCRTAVVLYHSSFEAD